MTFAEPAGAAFVVFGTLPLDQPETGGARAELLADEMRDQAKTPGFVSARIHLSLDGTTVVNRGEWVSEAAFHEAHTSLESGVLGSLPWRSGRTAVTCFGGPRAAHVEGPAAAEPPGFVALATRHVDGHEAALAVVDLLVRTGEWKRHSAGFISATPYISPDGRTFVNYPQWVDEAAYRRYISDPRIAEAQEAIARLEVAPPEYLLCRVTAEIGAPRYSGRQG